MRAPAARQRPVSLQAHGRLPTCRGAIEAWMPDATTKEMPEAERAKTGRAVMPERPASGREAYDPDRRAAGAHSQP